MKINPFVYGALVLAMFLGIITGSQFVGIWSVSGKITSTGEQVQPSAADINSIKGWMTLEQVTTTFQVPLPELLVAFDLPADTPPTTALKDLESEIFSVTSLRTWLQEQMVTSALPTMESTIMEGNPVAVPTAQLMATPTALAKLDNTPAPTEHEASLKTMTGKTTFQELLDWGVPASSIQAVIGSELPARSAVIKDFVTGQGLEFTSIKSRLQVEIDKVK